MDKVSFLCVISFFLFRYTFKTWKEKKKRQEVLLYTDDTLISFKRSHVFSDQLLFPFSLSPFRCWQLDNKEAAINSWWMQNHMIPAAFDWWHGVA